MTDHRTSTHAGTKIEEIRKRRAESIKNRVDAARWHLGVLRRDLIAAGFEEEARRVGNFAAHLSDLSLAVCKRLSGRDCISG